MKKILSDGTFGCFAVVCFVIIGVLFAGCGNLDYVVKDGVKYKKVYRPTKEGSKTDWEYRLERVE